jgi:hypothetical protein
LQKDLEELQSGLVDHFPSSKHVQERKGLLLHLLDNKQLLGTLRIEIGSSNLLVMIHQPMCHFDTWLECQSQPCRTIQQDKSTGLSSLLGSIYLEDTLNKLSFRLKVGIDQQDKLLQYLSQLCTCVL